MCCHYGSSRSSNCCLSTLVFSAAAMRAKFFFCNFRLSLKAQEVARSNVSRLLAEAEKMCLCTAQSELCLHYVTTGETTMIAKAACCSAAPTSLLLPRRTSVVTWNLTQNYSFLLMSASFSLVYCVWDNLWSAGKGKQSSRVYTNVNESSHNHRNTNDPGVRLDYYKSGLELFGVCRII